MWEEMVRGSGGGPGAYVCGGGGGGGERRGAKENYVAIVGLVNCTDKNNNGDKQRAGRRRNQLTVVEVLGSRSSGMRGDTLCV